MSEMRPRAKRAFWPRFAKRDDNGGSDRAIARADKPCASVDKSRSAVWTNERPRHAFRLGSEGGRQRTKSAMRERTQGALAVLAAPWHRLLHPMRAMPLPARRDETPPPKLVVLSGWPTMSTSHLTVFRSRRDSGLPWVRGNLVRARSAQIWVLLVAGVVVPHALRIAHHGSVITRDL
jgi:hypothetical protein